jgi:hypothetical protein
MKASVRPQPLRRSLPPTVVAQVPEVTTSETCEPARAFRPVPFWSWNEQMRPDEVRRQVELIRQGGWGGAFIHARVGLTIPYLGSEWFDACDATIEACRAKGMGVWLYDEDTWPSGFSGGRVPAAGAEHRMKALIARPSHLSPPEHCEPVGAPAGGVQVYCWTAPMANPWFYGACYGDLMNPATVERFLDDAYRSYHDRYAKHYSSLIAAEFTDEPSPIFRLGLPRGAVPFSPVLLERFQQMHGYDSLPHLGKLFADAPDAVAFRVAYFRAVADLFERNYSQAVGQWCREHGIALTGHFMAEHSLYEQILWGTPVMPNYRHQAIPGIDHLARQVNELLTAKQCQSVVNQYGKQRMLSELYGVSGQGLTFADRWWIACQQIGLGVNLLNPHLALYTLAGCRKRDYPPNLFYQQPWWPVNHVLDDALSRLCEAMAQGVYAADVLVLHPADTAAGLWRGDVPTDLAQARQDDVWDHEPTAPGVKADIDAVDESFKDILCRLTAAQRQFDLGDETILADDGDIELRDGRPMLRVGQMTYAAVVVPPMQTIRQTTLSLLERFIAAGGIVRCCGGFPSLLDGRPSTLPTQRLTAAQAVDAADLAHSLDEACPVLVRFNAHQALRPHLLAHVRRLDDGQRTVYVTNLSRTLGGDVSVALAGTWAAQRLDPWRGEWRAIETHTRDNRTSLQLSLPPTQTALFRLKPAVAPAPHANGRAHPAPSAAVELREWSVDRLDDNALTLDNAYWREGNGPWSAAPLPLIAVKQRLDALRYHGPLSLRFVCRATVAGTQRPVKLVLEYPERFDIRINGRRVEYQGLPHWRDIRWMPIDITGLLQAGDNQIELHCPDFQAGRRDALHDPIARYGTEIESIYLVGDIAVAARPRKARPECPRWTEFKLPEVRQWLLPADEPLAIDAPFPLTCGDVTPQGLPFYAGRLVYRTTLPPGDRPRTLRLECLDAAVAEVAIDGRTVGHILTHPLELSLPASGGELTLTLYGTLRNLLGPHHHPEGELPVVSPPLFEPVLDEPIAQSVLAWAEGHLRPRRWVDGYWLVGFGEIGRVTLVEEG